MDISGKLNQVNGRLRSAQVGVTVEQYGQSLRLRATLPPKPGSDRDRPFQQRISLGLPANPAGLKEAEKKARLVGGQLIAGEFQWEKYYPSVAEASLSKPCQEWISEFEEHYLSTGGQPATWSGDYAKVLKRLPSDRLLTAEQLEGVVLSFRPNTKSRVRACMATAAIAKFAGVAFDPASMRGNYSPAKVTRRDLPDDELIARCRDEIRNKAWQWVYGMMATYGLRNHEVFHLDLDLFPIIRVLAPTKTGAREVWPCYPEWAEAWRLGEPLLPPINLDRSNDKIGHSATSYLSPKLPFVPYDLRHAWAIRTLEFGWPDALSAQQMGHSLEVHNRTYQRWITARHHQRIYDLLVNRPDRPRPPTVTPS
ncbi:site-specific integrase [Almyronema epifaneia]|uniref:Site-specific integrase n=1 Tax=Almyronema epifaneia S1 TaxID=2991925 RepID=A0ABW6IK17_9CYAN